MLTQARKSGQFRSDIAALMGNIAAVIEENGGVVAVGIEKSIRITRDLFSMIETGQLSLERAGGERNKIFPEIAGRSAALEGRAASDRAVGRGSEQGET